MKLALEQAKVGARTPATVLLKGDEGTGKELFARAIHNESDRKHNKFIRVNCGSISHINIEKELFGYEQSGKHAMKKTGYFEKANSGTLFLDKIDMVPYGIQSQLFYALESNTIVRVGGTEQIPINVKVIASTQLNIEKLITQNKFRENLYYRLNRLPIYIPKLSERK